MKLFVDDELIETWSLEYNDPKKSHICGNPIYTDFVLEYVMILEHSGPALKVKFESNFDEGTGNESWGISNFLVEYNPVCLVPGQVY